MERFRRVRVAMAPVEGDGTFYCSKEYESRAKKEFDGEGPYVHARNVAGIPHDTDGYLADVDGEEWVVLIPIEIPDVDAESGGDGLE